MTKKEVCSEILNRCGIQKQSMIACEECAELIQAISKKMRCYEAHDNLIEEIADVTIMIEQLKIQFRLSDKDIDTMVKLKLLRTAERLGFYVGEIE